MSRKGLAIWLLLSALALALAGATPAGVPEDDRRQILAQLAGEMPPARLAAAAVFLGGDLAAVRLPAGDAEPVVYVLERDQDGAESWRAVARITAPGEAHFGDAVLLNPSAILVAAPDTAGAGLGPGATYVFQRDVGGKDHWGLVGKLALGDYPPVGAVTVQQLSAPAVAAPAATEVVAAVVAPPPPVAASLPIAFEPPSVIAESPPVVAPPPPPVVAPPSPPTEVVPPVTAVPPAAAAVAPPAVAVSATVEVAEEESDPPAPAADSESDDNSRPEAAGELRYVAVANMKERPRALDLAASLRDRGYPSEVHRNHRGFFVVTLARLPLLEARQKRAEAVAAGDVSEDAYLIEGTGFRERISP